MCLICHQEKGFVQRYDKVSVSLEFHPIQHGDTLKKSKRKTIFLFAMIVQRKRQPTVAVHPNILKIFLLMPSGKSLDGRRRFNTSFMAKISALGFRGYDLCILVSKGFVMGL